MSSDRSTSAHAVHRFAGAVAEFARAHPVASYFALAFAISWGGILVVVGPTGVLATKAVFDSLIWVPALLAGPSIAGILVTTATGGRQGLRALAARFVRGRVGARWYAVALVTAPAYYLVVSFALSAFSRAYLPAIATADDRTAILVRGFVVGISAGVFEELGWTGVAVPALRRRRGAFETGLAVGLLWGGWHILPKLLGERAFDMLDYIPIDLLSTIVALAGFRVLMVWVYERTHSVLIAVLMHGSLTAGMFLVQPAVTGSAMITLGIAQAVAAWMLVGAVAIVMHIRATRVGDHGEVAT